MEEMYTLYFVRMDFVCVVHLYVVRDLGIFEEAIKFGGFS